MSSKKSLANLPEQWKKLSKPTSANANVSGSIQVYSSRVQSFFDNLYVYSYVNEAEGNTTTWCHSKSSVSLKISILYYCYFQFTAKNFAAQQRDK